MAHAFISYVRENSEIVDRLASELRSRGIEVWLDRDNIKPGMYFKDAIKEAIQEVAFFIACYSKELNDRLETYIHGELGIAIDRLRQMPRNRVWFIPVLLNEAEIPHHPISDRESLKDIQTISLFNNWNGGITEILEAMKLHDPIHRRVMHLSNLIRYHPTERHYATQQLAKIGPAAADAVPALTEALRDSDADVRRSAAGALRGIGPAAADAVPALREALRASHGVLWSHYDISRAEYVLEKIGSRPLWLGD